MKRVIAGIAIATGCIGGAAAQSTDPSDFVGLWCSGTLHAVGPGSIELTVASVNAGMAFGTYIWKGSDALSAAIQGNVAGDVLTVDVFPNVSLRLPLRNGRLVGTLTNHRVRRTWEVTLTRRESC
jgi:hypothetical protein